MTSIFVDTDVVLDLLAARQPFYPYAARLFTLADRGELKLHVSALIFSNLHYILRKQLGSTAALQYLQKLKLMVAILPVDGRIIDLALASSFSDFEDAIQYYAAREAGLKYLVTRNVKDYGNADMVVCNTEDFLRSLDV